MDNISYTTSDINGAFQSSVLANYLIFGTTAEPTRFSFDMSSIRWTSSGSGDLHFVALGTFHDADGTFSTNAADISGSFTQAATGAVNASFTFETPPAPSTIGTPEPTSMAILLGLGTVIGIGCYKRDRRK